MRMTTVSRLISAVLRPPRSHALRGNARPRCSASFGHPRSQAPLGNARPRSSASLFALVAVLTLAGQYARAATPEPTREQVKFFEEKVRPILAENCYKCH